MHNNKNNNKHSVEEKGQRQMNSDIKKLQWLPYGTEEHAKAVKTIQKQLTYKDFVLCMAGKFEPNRYPENDYNTTTKNHNRIGTTQNAFSGNENVFSSQKYYFVHRNKAEYNLQHRQVNVGILITDRSGRVLILKKSNGFLSIVGGHVDYAKTAYDMTVREICYQNIVKELHEEVKFTGNIEVETEPLFFITEGKDMYDFLHCWYVYNVVVDNLDDYKFKSNEKDKHEVVIMSMKELINAEGTKLRVKYSLHQAVGYLYHQIYQTPDVNIKVDRPKIVKGV